MQLFEIDNGTLIPAQFGRLMKELIPADVLHSVRSQILKVVNKPLFPVNWVQAKSFYSNTPSDIPDELDSAQRLISFDLSGQLVVVDVISVLDSKVLTNALAFLSKASNMPWKDIASFYPGGLQEFRVAWLAFKEQTPLVSTSAPRLILVVDKIEQSLRPALDVLLDSGLTIYEMNLRSMTNGRRFLEVTQVVSTSHNTSVETMLTAGQQMKQVGGSVSPLVKVRETKVAEPKASVPAGRVLRRRRSEVVQGTAQSSSVESVATPATHSDPSTYLQTIDGAKVYSRALKQGGYKADAVTHALAEPKLKMVGDAGVTSALGVDGVNASGVSLRHRHDTSRFSRTSTSGSTTSRADGVGAGNTAVPVQPQPQSVLSMTGADLPVVNYDSQGLAVISALHPQKISLYLPAICKGGTFGFLENGEIKAINSHFADPNEAYLAVADYFMVNLDARIHPASGWDAIRLGTASGPTLTEVVREINRSGTFSVPEFKI